MLNAVAQALHLGQDERTYLFDLARAARPARRAPSHRRAARISRSRPVCPVAAGLHDDGLGVRAQRPPGHHRQQPAGPSPARAWAAHDVRTRHDGTKRLWHPGVGELELTYQSLDLSMSNRTVHDPTVYTAEPGTASEDRLKLLAGLAATQPQATQPTDQQG